jgi:DNA mismatch repair ATPase MutS
MGPPSRACLSPIVPAPRRHSRGAGVSTHYQRRQTLKNAERYVTPELNEHEERSCRPRTSRQREYELFVAARDRLGAQTEYLHDKAGCRALFATHYHELARLADRHDGLRNYNAEVQEGPDGIVFLQRIAPGTLPTKKPADPVTPAAWAEQESGGAIRAG